MLSTCSPGEEPCTPGTLHEDPPLLRRCHLIASIVDTIGLGREPSNIEAYQGDRMQMLIVVDQESLLVISGTQSR